jgi:hypothetical protein
MLQLPLYAFALIITPLAGCTDAMIFRIIYFAAAISWPFSMPFSLTAFGFHYASAIALSLDIDI